ncbi:MAG: response regulator transcription factor [Chloroflexi bacterium]|nr:response regulator transcription factor [Chloroflexota bacterium]
MSSDMNSEITIVIADDHPMVRTGLRSMLNVPRVRIVGEAENGDEAVRMALALKPTVVLMDVRMPGMDGIQALETLMNAKSSARVIMLTTYRSTAYLLRSLSAGAVGFVLKDIAREDLLATIYAVASGTSMVDSQFLKSVLRNLENEPGGKDTPPENIEPLTAREKDILRLMVEGLTNQAIADVLSLSVGTVKGHAHTILQKLGTNDRTQAAVKAIRLGLIK